MNIRLNFQQKKPLAEQIHERIRDEITGQAIKPGEQLPTVRDMAAQLGVNFNTVARAYRMLDMEGWISTRQGRGSYVIERQHAEDEAETAMESADSLGDSEPGEVTSSVMELTELTEMADLEYSEQESAKIGPVNADGFLDAVLTSATQAGISHLELAVAILNRFGHTLTPHPIPPLGRARVQKHVRASRRQGEFSNLGKVGIKPRRQVRRNVRLIS